MKTNIIDILIDEINHKHSITDEILSNKLSFIEIKILLKSLIIIHNENFKFDESNIKLIQNIEVFNKILLEEYKFTDKTLLYSEFCCNYVNKIVN